MQYVNDLLEGVYGKKKTTQIKPYITKKGNNLIITKPKKKLVLYIDDKFDKDDDTLKQLK